MGASVRSLAEACLRDGFQVWCADQFADADLMATVGKDRVILLTQGRPDTAELARFPHDAWVVPVGGLESNETLLQELQAAGRRVAAESAVVKRVRNPNLLFSAMQSHGIAVPRWCTHIADVPPEGRWLRKNSYASGGLHVECANRSVAERHNDHDGWYFQERLNGISCSATFVSQRSADGSTESRLLGCTLQLSGRSELNAPGFAYCGNAGPLNLRDDLKKAIVQAGNIVQQQFLPRGVFGIDFIISDGQPFLLEVNPRVTASHELLEHTSAVQSSLIRLHVQDFAGDDSAAASPPHPSDSLAKHFDAGNPRDCYARLVLYTPLDIDVTAAFTETMMKWNGALRSTGRFERVADIPAPDQQLPAGSPLCSLYVKLEAAADGSERPFSPAWLPDLATLLPSFRLSSRVPELCRQVQAEIRSLETDREIRN